MGLVKTAAFLMFAVALRAQEPFRVDYACAPADIESFGMACSMEEPCAIFLELASVEAVGARLFVSGNLHTATTTLYSILLASDDGGKTWTEAHGRLRAAVLEQIQFVDLERGWVSGQALEPLPRDPFLLATTDGGKIWRQRPVLEDSSFGAVAQFWFESPTAGELVIDRPQGVGARFARYETRTGGESWTPTETSATPIRLQKAAARPDTGWRVRADAPSKTYRIERAGGKTWETVASFVIHVRDCQ